MPGCVKVKKHTFYLPARFLEGGSITDFLTADDCGSAGSGSDGSGGSGSGGSESHCCGIYIKSDTSEYHGPEQYVIFHDTETSVCSPGTSWTVERDGVNAPIEITLSIDLPDMSPLVLGDNVVETVNAGDICASIVAVRLTNPDNDYSVVWGMSAGPPQWTDQPTVKNLTAREDVFIGVAEELTGDLTFYHQNHAHKFEIRSNRGMTDPQRIILPKHQSSDRYQFLTQVAVNGGVEAITEWVGLAIHNQSGSIVTPLPPTTPACNWRELSFDPISFGVGLIESPGGCDTRFSPAVVGDGPDVTDQTNDEIVKDQIPYITTLGITESFYAIDIVLDEDGEPCIRDIGLTFERGLAKLIFTPEENEELTEAVFGQGVGCAGSGSGSGSTDGDPIENPGYIDVVTCVDLVDGKIRTQKTRIKLPPWIKLFDQGCTIEEVCEECPELVSTDCGNVPSVLTGTHNCDNCGETVTLTYDGVDSWDGANDCSGSDLDWEMVCLGENTWQMSYSYNGASAVSTTATPTSLSPFVITFDFGSRPFFCGGGGGALAITVTEP